MEKINISIIRLFKAVPITVKGKKKADKKLLEETIKRGFIFSPEVIANYSNAELAELIKVVENEVGLTSEQMNNSFHKSWKKVKEASIEQLVIEQIIHYITTYGFESMGIYNENSVYIPNEKLELPKVDLDQINLVVIRGCTKEQLKLKLLSLLNSGIALGEDTIKDAVEIAIFVKLNEKDLETIRNKEVKVALYDYLELVPENPIEFLRFVVYKSTKSTLLIKDKNTIEKIKSSEVKGINALFVKYKKEHGLERLAEIFHRFKPIFLSLRRKDSQMNHIINRIRKLAKKNHKPMKADYLNDITANIKKGEKIEEKKLKEELSKVNIFRKVRLAYSLKFRTRGVDSIMYRIRNGKAYSTSVEEYTQPQKNVVKRVLDTVLESITSDIKPNVKGKKVYIPENITYTLPATEKQFTGDFPSGTCVSVPKDMVVGVHWENQEGHRIDLDLSMVNADSKIGWDASYRTEGGDILFSGDMTDARKPNGASELFYVKRQSNGAHILFVNYFNFESDVEVPIKIFAAKEEIKNMKQNYMVNPNNMVSIAKSKINQKQKILGLLVTTASECRFYFAESYIGASITSSNSRFAENSRKYLVDFYSNTISLNNILLKAGCKMVKDKEKCDIDLSPESLEKSKIINLLKEK